ncbi:MAG: alpha-mannosidase [Promethearchaeota archaeon]
MPEMKKYTGHVVSHTHWDREWYLTFQEFRVKLVKLVDDLLQVCRSVPEFGSFQLDGQTLPLEDYLQIRPHNREELEQFVKTGKIVVGPWYVLADEFLASAEATVRNLLLGHKIAWEFGAVMKVGYVPDTFGHVWQLPQILAGFGIRYSYLFRGYPPLFGGHEENAKKNTDFPLEHYWAAPDGTRVLNLHHIVGYGDAGRLCEGDPGEAAPIPDLRYISGFSKILMSAARQVPRVSAPHLLFMNGGDHQGAESCLPDFFKAWNSNEDIKEEEGLDIHLRHARLEEYFRAVEGSGVNFPTLSGEMRGSAYTQVTPSCLSTRMYLKIQSYQCARALERYAEPLASIAHYYLGVPYPATFLWESWKWYLKNQPHDSICGCSLDRVHDDMETRFAWSLDIAYQVANTSLDALTRRVVLPESWPPLPAGAKGIAFAAWNLNGCTSPRVVTGLVASRGNGPWRVLDDQGVELPGAVVREISDYRDLPRGQYLYKRFKSTWRVLAVTLLTSLPSYGFRTFRVEPATPTTHLANGVPAGSEGAQGTPALPDGFSPVVVEGVDGAIVDNGRVRVTFREDGSFDLLDHETGRTFESCNLFEDMADDGDEYDYSPLPGEVPLTTTGLVARREVAIDSPLLVVVRVAVDFPVPSRLEGDWRKGERRARSGKFVTLRLESTVTVTAGSKLVEVVTKLENRADDHRLRVLFPSGIAAGRSHADEHFMVQERDVDLPDDEGWYQPAQGLYHQDSFVSLSDEDEDYGLTVLNRGLPEFEVLRPNGPDAACTLALTLFRSVGWLSKQTHLARPTGLNGPALPTPGAQCRRDFTFEYAVHPHSGDWSNRELCASVQWYTTPPVFHEIDPDVKEEGLFWSGTSFLEVTNHVVRVSALKRAERPDGLALRLYNPSSRPQTTQVRFLKEAFKLVPVNLLEDPIEDRTPITAQGGEPVTIVLPPYKILTYLLEK